MKRRLAAPQQPGSGRRCRRRDPERLLVVVLVVVAVALVLVGIDVAAFLSVVFVVFVVVVISRIDRRRERTHRTGRHGPPVGERPSACVVAWESHRSANVTAQSAIDSTPGHRDDGVAPTPESTDNRCGRRHPARGRGPRADNEQRQQLPATDGGCARAAQAASSAACSPRSSRRPEYRCGPCSPMARSSKAAARSPPLRCASAARRRNAGSPSSATSVFSRPTSTAASTSTATSRSRSGPASTAATISSGIRSSSCATNGTSGGIRTARLLRRKSMRVSTTGWGRSSIGTGSTIRQ